MEGDAGTSRLNPHDIPRESDASVEPDARTDAESDLHQDQPAEVAATDDVVRRPERSAAAGSSPSASRCSS